MQIEEMRVCSTCRQVQSITMTDKGQDSTLSVMYILFYFIFLFYVNTFHFIQFYFILLLLIVLLYQSFYYFILFILYIFRHMFLASGEPESSLIMQDFYFYFCYVY